MEILTRTRSQAHVIVDLGRVVARIIIASYAILFAYINELVDIGRDFWFIIPLLIAFLTIGVSYRDIAITTWEEQVRPRSE